MREKIAITDRQTVRAARARLCVKRMSAETETPTWESKNVIRVRITEKRRARRITVHPVSHVMQVVSGKLRPVDIVEMERRMERSSVTERLD